MTFATMCFIVLGLIGVSSLSFIAGQHLQTATLSDILNLKSASQIFTYNRLFAERPNITSDKAWLDLFPSQGGFFQHPELAPTRSTFAVFHQLHCLDGIRHGYWSLLDMVVEGKQMNETDLPYHASGPHIRHCIDLLRNVLMCQPDLTLEVKNEELGGVTGFGTEHQCVDWKALVDWTSEWETFEQKAKQPQSAEDKLDEEEKLNGAEHGHAHHHK